MSFSFHQCLGPADFAKCTRNNTTVCGGMTRMAAAYHFLRGLTHRTETLHLQFVGLSANPHQCKCLLVRYCHPAMEPSHQSSKSIKPPMTCSCVHTLTHFRLKCYILYCLFLMLFKICNCMYVTFQSCSANNSSYLVNDCILSL